MGRPSEATVRKLVEAQLGTPLSKRKALVGHKSNGEELYCEFDGVSPDGQVIIEIKSNELVATDDKPLGRYKSAIKQALITDIYRLSRATATAKFLVLTDRALFDAFTRDMDGFLPEALTILYCCANREESA